MGQFKQTVVIKCDIDRAFDYISNWQNLKSFMSNILDINPISFVHYGPGATFDTVFKMGGANIPTTLEVQEFVRNQRLILKSRQGLKMSGGWEFKKTSEGVVVTFSLEYDLPTDVIRSSRDREKIQKDFNESATQSILLLKWILESETLQSKEGY